MILIYCPPYSDLRTFDKNIWKKENQGKNVILHFMHEILSILKCPSHLNWWSLHHAQWHLTVTTLCFHFNWYCLSVYTLDLNLSPMLRPIFHLLSEISRQLTLNILFTMPWKSQTFWQPQLMILASHAHFPKHLTCGAASHHFKKSCPSSMMLPGRRTAHTPAHTLIKTHLKYNLLHI